VLLRESSRVGALEDWSEQVGVEVVVEDRYRVEELMSMAC
jgi:hypothetical protein